MEKTVMTIGKPVAGVCVSTALFVCGAAGYPSAPSTVPEGTGSLVLQADAVSGGDVPVEAGGEVIIEGSGFAGDAAVTITMYSTPRELAHVTADGDGDLRAEVPIPDDAVGSHTLTAIGNDPSGDPHVLTTQIAVAVPDRQSGAISSLPRTGLNIVAMLIGGFGLLVAGFALVRSAVFGRRLYGD